MACTLAERKPLKIRCADFNFSFFGLRVWVCVEQQVGTVNLLVNHVLEEKWSTAHDALDNAGVIECGIEAELTNNTSKVSVYIYIYISTCYCFVLGV